MSPQVKEEPRMRIARRMSIHRLLGERTEAKEQHEQNMESDFHGRLPFLPGRSNAPLHLALHGGH